MSSKANPGLFDCYTAAKPDEEMFVLLGRDPLAGALVRLWADERERNGGDPEKVKEARNCAFRLDEDCIRAGKRPTICWQDLKTLDYLVAE